MTDLEVKRAEAFVIAQDDLKAKFPEKNFCTIVPKELEKENYSILVLQGGTNEVSNLDVSGNVGQKIESLKNEIRTSSEKLFSLAQKSLKENKCLKKVIILKRIFRCDLLIEDPSQIRNKLSEYGNRVLEDIYLSKGCPDNISISYQPLECHDALRALRYGQPTARNYDGVHLRGNLAVQHYTGSIVNVLIDTLPNLAHKPTINILPPTDSYAKTQFPQRNSAPAHSSRGERQPVPPTASTPAGNPWSRNLNSFASNLFNSGN